MATLNSTGWTAHYSAPNSDEGIGDILDVHSFDPDTGLAMVVDRTRGKLVAANSYQNFARLETCPTIAAVLPGAGHHVHWNETADGEEFTEPASAIVCTSYATIYAVTVDAEGLDEIVDEHSPGARLCSNPSCRIGPLKDPQQMDDS